MLVCFWVRKTIECLLQLGILKATKMIIGMEKQVTGTSVLRVFKCFLIGFKTSPCNKTPVNYCKLDQELDRS